MAVLLEIGATDRAELLTFPGPKCGDEHKGCASEPTVILHLRGPKSASGSEQRCPSPKQNGSNRLKLNTLIHVLWINGTQLRR